MEFRVQFPIRTETFSSLPSLTLKSLVTFKARSFLDLKGINQIRYHYRLCLFSGTKLKKLNVQAIQTIVWIEVNPLVDAMAIGDVKNTALVQLKIFYTITTPRILRILKIRLVHVLHSNRRFFVP